MNELFESSEIFISWLVSKAYDQSMSLLLFVLARQTHDALMGDLNPRRNICAATYVWVLIDRGKNGFVPK